VQSTPSLRAAYLAKFDRIQDLLVESACSRADRAGRHLDRGDPAVHAVVGAVVASLLASHRACAHPGHEPEFEAALDAAMAAVQAIETTMCDQDALRADRPAS